MATSRTIEWFAGLLEGEGCFCLCPNGPGSRIPRIVVAMTDLDVIEEAAKFLHSKTRVSRKSSDKLKTLFMAASAKRSIVEPLLHRLYPHMGTRRQQRINDLLLHYAEKDKYLGNERTFNING